jgi:hypothetical protein
LFPQRHSRRIIQMMLSFPQPNPHIIKYLLQDKGFFVTVLSYEVFCKILPVWIFLFYNL